MRSVRIATWTSGDPVSPDLVAYSLISSCLRSALIDIEKFLTVCGFMMAGPGCRPARSALAGVGLIAQRERVQYRDYRRRGQQNLRPVWPTSFGCKTGPRRAQRQIEYAFGVKLAALHLAERNQRAAQGGIHGAFDDRGVAAPEEHGLSPPEPVSVGS